MHVHHMIHNSSSCIGRHFKWGYTDRAQQGYLSIHAYAYGLPSVLPVRQARHIYRAISPGLLMIRFMALGKEMMIMVFLEGQKFPLFDSKKEGRGQTHSD